jgi:hypothetical protein
VRVRLASTGGLRGKVLDTPAGRSLGQALVLVVDEHLEEIRQRAICDADGSFALTNLPPGRYQCLALDRHWHQEEEWPELRDRLQQVEVRSGAAAVVELVAVGP